MQDLSQSHEIRERLAVIGILFVILYCLTFKELMHVWASNEDYSHGFLVLPISLYLIWRKRGQLIDLSAQPVNWGKALIILWGILYFIGIVGAIATIAYISMIIFLIGALAFLVGSKIVRLFLFPLIFLVFMFPIPSEIYTRLTNPLMLVSTSASFQVLDSLHLPVLREGNLITLPNYSMQVVVACSGIRSLISIIALALLMGYLAVSSNIQRVILVLLALPIAMLGNVFRIVATALLAFYVSSQMADGFSHAMAGVVTFVLCFFLLLGCMGFLLWTGREKEPLY